MTTHDEDEGKGAVEQDRREESTNVSSTGANRGNTDYPEPGENEEHTGEPRDTDVNPEGLTQDPGFRQKANQNKRKENLLAD